MFSCIKNQISIKISFKLVIHHYK